MNLREATERIGLTLVFPLTFLLAPALVWGQNNTEPKPKPVKTAPPATARPQTPAAPTRPASPSTPPNATPQTTPRYGQPPQSNQGQQQPRPVPSAPQRPYPPSPPTQGRPQVTPSRPFAAPAGAVASARPGGGSTYSHADGRKWEVGNSGQLSHFSKPNVDARFREGGALGSARVTRPDRSVMTINRGTHGERVIAVVRPDGSRLVSQGPNRGFVERPFRPGYVQRTYVANGRSYVSVYRLSTYGGVSYREYVPSVRYSPAFYAWAYSPWPTPLAYSWGWGIQPWFGYYGGYFVPAPYYASPALLLADFVLAEDMRRAYADMPPPDPGQPPYAPPYPYDPQGQPVLSPQVKNLIANEVSADLARQQNGNTPPPPNSGTLAFKLDPNERTLPVSSVLNVAGAGGQTCSLSPGNLIFRSGDTISSANTIQITVLNSFPGDCPSGTTVDMDLADFTEIRNRFHEDAGSGVQYLAQNEGQGGLPNGPPANPQVLPDTLPPPDPNAQRDLQQLQLDGKQTETQVLQDAGSGPLHP